MKYTPENLLQIFMNSSLTTEAQGVFDRLMRENPEFAEKVTAAMAERMGTVPDETVYQISSRLDSKLEAIWVKNQPSKIASFFRVVMKGSLVFAVLGFLGYSVYVLWPKLLILLPQIDLSSSSSLNTQVPRVQLAPPVMLAPQSDESETSVSVKSLPTKVVVAQKKILPTATAALSKSTSETQSGDSIRLSVNTDKTQTVVVTVLSPNGILLRHLYQGLWVAGSHFVDWNGKDDSGNSVTPGNYTIVVQAGDKKMSGIVTIKPN